MPGQFDSKSFNAAAFKYAVDRIPNLVMNELKKSAALVGDPDIANMFSTQGGTEYGTIAMRGLIGGTAQNYDGQTDITATSTNTYERGVVVVGRAKAWKERDFSFDITGGVDFMDNIAQQLAWYEDYLDQVTLLATLEGIFLMTGSDNLEFVNNHTTDVSAEGTGLLGATTLNTAIAKACGANKSKFSLAFMHSAVATGLENLNLLEFMKYTDAQGIQRALPMATWNGRTVIVDDTMPVESVTEGSGETAVTYNKYTTYLLGNGAFGYEDVGVKVPYEMERNPSKNGGEDILYVRQRKVYAPFGISYTKSSQSSQSPTDAELKNGANWSLVHTGGTTKEYINHKAIPIAKIVSKG